MPQFFDMHCHIDFADNMCEVARDAGESITAVSSTVMPSSYVSARERLADFPGTHVALGIHPWWVADGRVGEVDVARFENLLGDCRIVGEIGLDFHGRRKESRHRQMQVLSRTLDAIRGCGGGRLVFLHAVKSYRDTFNLLDEHGTLDDNACVFHWFSGSPDYFARALAAGCYFSVNMRMLVSDSGAAFAKAIPDERLLLETDSPAHEGMPWSVDMWSERIEETARSLAEAREAEYEELLELLAHNSSRLLEEYGG